MNKGSSNHYTLLLQDETETDGICIEEEDEEIEDGLNGLEEEEEDEEEEEEEEEDEDDEPVEDSEEEIFSSSKHRTLSHHDGANLNGQNHMVSPTSEYRLLNNNDSDLKTVLDTPITIWTPTPMSPARRACFIASIMLGILVVATFLWVLPCDVQPCEGDLALRDREWAVKIEGMGINETLMIRRPGGGSNVLLSYYISNNISSWDTNSSTLADTDQWHSDHSQTDCIKCGGRSSGTESEEHCGLLMLDGNLGRENWRIPLRECPVDLQCGLLDVSGDRFPDCIVRGAYSMVFMIEARYGTTMWHLHMHKDSGVTPTTGQMSTEQPVPTPASLKLLYPGPALLIPDVNNDSFRDLLFFGLLSDSMSSWNQEHSEMWNSEEEVPEPLPDSHTTNQIVLVCGQSGSVLGSPFTLKQCHKILSIVLEGHLINFSCLDSHDSKKTGSIPLKALLHQILGDAAPSEKLVLSQKFSINDDRKSVAGDGKMECKVVVIPQGVCPLCQSEVQLRGDDDKVLWRRNYEHSTIVAWAPLWVHGQCHGAVLKVWEWRHISTRAKSVKPPPISRRTTRSSLVSEESNSAETEATNMENDHETEIHIETLTDGNVTSKSDDGEGLPYGELLRKYSMSNPGKLNEGIENPVQEKLTIQLPTTVESPRARRDFSHNSPKYVYDHSNLHRHHGKQTVGGHDDIIDHSETVHSLENFHPHESKEARSGDYHESHHHTKKVVSSTVVPVSTRLMHQNVLAPPGYQLQQIHERLAILRTNGTGWHEETLTSLGIGITQLCKNDSCVPSIESHGKSVEVTRGVKKRAWQLVSSSTTYVNTPLNGEQHHTSPWSLTSIIRKILVYL